MVELHRAGDGLIRERRVNHLNSVHDKALNSGSVLCCLSVDEVFRRSRRLQSTERIPCNLPLAAYVAFVVGPGGGSLYVDGKLRISQAWTGTARPPNASLYFPCTRSYLRGHAGRMSPHRRVSRVVCLPGSANLN